MPPVSVAVFVFAKAHALADIDEDGDLRVVDDFARGAAFDAEEEDEEASERETASNMMPNARAAGEFDRVAAVKVPDDGDERDRRRR